jgi:hypothetical protein
MILIYDKRRGRGSKQDNLLEMAHRKETDFS